MSLAVKAYLRCSSSDDRKWEIRRFFVPADIASSFVYIEEKLSTVIFPFLIRKKLNIQWKDEEGDMIMVSSDEELLTALACRKDDVLRLYVKVNSSSAQGDSNDGKKSSKDKEDNGTDTASNADEVHPLVTCDGCNKGIYGFRYKCLQCPDYDLCRNCESAKMHPQHMMVRLPKPVDAAGEWMFDRHAFGGRRHNKGSCRRPPTFAGFGHRRHHGFRCGGSGGVGNGEDKDSSAEECPGAAGYDQGSEQAQMGPPPVFPFHQVLHKIWTVLGGLPKDEGSEGCAAGGTSPSGSAPCGNGAQNPFGNGAQNIFTNEEFLKKVGETVAAVLDPLGINVDVNVEHKNGQRQHCGGGVFSGTGQKCGFAAPPPQHPQQQQTQKQQEPEERPQAAEETSPKATPGRDVPIPMPFVPMQTTPVVEPAPIVEQPLHMVDKFAEKEEIVAEVVEKRSATPPAATIYNGETGDWTYIGDKEKAAIPQTVEASVAPKPPMATTNTNNGGAIPKATMTGPPITSLANEMNQMKLQPTKSEEINHPNPAVRAGLQQMLSMGFTNEGGWLTQLLEVKGGDIYSVLEVLSPVNKTGK